MGRCSGKWYICTPIISGQVYKPRAVSLFRSHAAFMWMLQCSSCVVNQLFEGVVFRHVAEINLSENKLCLYPLVCSFVTVMLCEFVYSH